MNIQIGAEGSLSKKFCEADIYKFAQLSDDWNPIHTNEQVAQKSIFGKVIVHGMLVGSLISAVIGTVMPGEGTIYLEQDMIFTAPVFVGDECTAKVVVEDVLNDQKGIYKLKTVIMNQHGKVVIDGYAVVKYA